MALARDRRGSGGAARVADGGGGIRRHPVAPRSEPRGAVHRRAMAGARGGRAESGLLMPARLVIEGGEPLRGEVPVSAAKNAALPALCAALLTSEGVVLENVPELADVVT